MEFSLLNSLLFSLNFIFASPENDGTFQQNWESEGALVEVFLFFLGEN